MLEKIALSTSLSYRHNWDPIFSLDLTRKFCINKIQLYLGNNFSNSALIRKINIEYSTYFKFIIHSPVNLNYGALNSDIIQNIKDLIPGQRKVVYHHDLSCNLRDSLDIIEKLNSEGITVLLENFYPEAESVINNINSYIDVICGSANRGLKLYPLIDIPRLFIRHISEKYNSMELTKKLLFSVKDLNPNLYLHLIDVESISQSRDTWCSLGNGIIPYKDIFNIISYLKINIPMIILEYEEEKHIDGSLDYLKRNPI